jgi:DNA-directed RNA polymerase specialized sigma24 family protein
MIGRQPTASVYCARVRDLWADYTPASRRLVESLFRSEAPDPADVDVVRRTLASYLASLNVEVGIREDLIQETLLLLVSGVNRGIVDPSSNLAAFIRTITLNCVRDAARYRGRRPLVDSGQVPEPRSDDDLAGLIDAVSSATQVRAGLAAAIEAGDAELAGFIGEWLTLAERLEEAPSLREAAVALGMSHMKVSRQLARFGELVAALERSGGGA